MIQKCRPKKKKPFQRIKTYLVKALRKLNALFT